MQLENHHKVIIQFSRKEEDLVDPTISILIIRGRTENVNAAEIEVRSILAAAPATISEEIEVPRASLGIIIGRRMIAQIGIYII